jgi:mono/diheme cytochrome c family protein
MLFLVKTLPRYVSRWGGIALISACALFIALLPAMTPAAAGRTVWDHVYTDAQAGRGVQVFIDHCALCHAVNMQGGPGGAPALVGPEFKFVWNDQTVGALFVVIRAKMPPGAAGNLSDQEYADIVAVILQGNGFPAGGGQELPGDGVLTSDIRITWDQPGK